MTAQGISDRELEAFANKLEAFGQGLTAKEQSLLREILVRAALSDEDDVQAHAMIVDPTVSQHVRRLAGPTAWFEVGHQLQAVVLHLGRLHNLLAGTRSRKSRF